MVFFNFGKESKIHASVLINYSKYDLPTVKLAYGYFDVNDNNKPIIVAHEDFLLATGCPYTFLPKTEFASLCAAGNMAPVKTVRRWIYNDYEGVETRVLNNNLCFIRFESSEDVKIVDEKNGKELAYLQLTGDLNEFGRDPS